MTNSISIKKPPPLKQGDTVAVIAPASHFDRTAFERGIKRIESWGFKIQFQKDIFERHRYLAGGDQRRADELCHALQDPKIKAIFCARGGYGSQRLLPYLEKLDAKLPPKIFLGYSDLTAVLNFLQQRWAWVCFHGPVVAKDLGDRFGAVGEASLLRTLMDPSPLGVLKTDAMACLYPGQAKGPLVGGCLSLIATSLGTPYQLNTQACVLFLEDVGELLYSLDRMLTQLRFAGLFEQAKGIVFGPLKDSHHDPKYIQDMLVDVLGDLKLPMSFGFPSGHTEDSWTIPMGLPVVLDADAGTLEFCEGALEWI